MLGTAVGYHGIETLVVYVLGFGCCEVGMRAMMRSGRMVGRYLLRCVLSPEMNVGHAHWAFQVGSQLDCESVRTAG